MTDFETDVIERLTRIEEAIKPVADHETRLRAVETKTTLISGIGMVLAVIITPVLGWFGLHVKLL